MITDDVALPGQIGNDPGSDPTPGADPDWLDISKKAYASSTNFLDQGIRDRWARNYALANSKHPPGSKYHGEKYKRRSRVFRGKTAAAIMQKEAALAVAMFSTQDVLHISPENGGVEEQQLTADTLNTLVNYHLEHDIPWFQVSIGAHKEALTAGTVVSKQYWIYETEEGENGEGEVIEDKPVVELLPLENVRIHQEAYWLDPLNSSPFVILMQQMFIGDIKARMAVDWIELDESLLTNTDNKDDDAIRRAREEQNKEDITQGYIDHETAWVYEVYLRHEGEELVFYTLSDKALLSEPLPLSTVYPHCKRKRNLAMGFSAIEPHKVYRTGLPERVEGAQVQANTIANQRFDNVQLALNRRFIYKRDAGVDTVALRTSVPGGIIPADDVDGVKPLDFRDVTGSSYQEQNLVNNDFDELAGTFSQSSVSGNRQLNETVGGMEMLKGGSNALTEYQLRIFVETWVEEVVRQLVEMVKFYEDNDVIKRVTGDHDLNAGTLQSDVKSRVNAGFGSTDPQKRVEKLMFGLGAVAKVAPDKIQGMDDKEVISEIFGALGYKDGDRFFPNLDENEDDPQVQQLKKQLTELQKIIETDQLKYTVQFKIEQLVQEGMNRREAEKQVTERMKAKSAREKWIAELATKMNTDSQKLRGEHGLKRDDLSLKALAVINDRMEAMNTRNELAFKAANPGRMGI